MALNANVQTVTTSTPGRSFSPSVTSSKRTNVRLWITQGALAALFLFAGASKLVMPADQLTSGSDFPVWFLRFIGGAEFLGAFGLVLPWALRIRPGLTPLAAAGLAIIMVGATVTVLVSSTPAFAVIDVLIGVAALSVVTGRRGYAARSK